jgi:SOS response regulatory protein OraA/RecX
MGEWLSKLDGGTLVWVAAILGVTVYSIVAALIQAWRRVRSAEMEASLKQQMLDKGLSPEDIERVLRASGKSGGGPASTGAGTRAAVVETLAENGLSGDDIERVLRAFQDGSRADRHAAPAPGSAERVAAVETMLDNGLSAEDVERVLKAFAADAPLTAAQRTALVEKMAQSGMDAKDIERVLRALAVPDAQVPAAPAAVGNSR